MSDISKLPRYTQREIVVNHFGEEFTLGYIKRGTSTTFLWVSPHGVGPKLEQMIMNVTFLIEAVLGGPINLNDVSSQDIVSSLNGVLHVTMTLYEISEGV